MEQGTYGYGDTTPAEIRFDRTTTRGHGRRSAALVLAAIAVVAVMVFSYAGGASLVTGSVIAVHGVLDPQPQVMADVIGAIPSSATLVGPLSASSPVSISLELALPNSAALATYENGLYTPGSSSYHDYLSLSQFYQTYGPTPASVASLLQYLRSAGLTVVPTSGPWIYTVSGTSAQMSAAFSAPLYQYQASSGVVKDAPLGLPSLPPGLAPLVGSLYGLNQFDLAAPTLLTPTTTAAGATTPSVMRGFYNSATLISGGDTGSSYAIGLAEMCDPSESTSTLTSDLTTFDSDYGLPAATVHYLGSGASSCSPGSSGWGVETDLDMQWAHAMAPGATLYVCLDDSNPATCDQTFVSDHATDNIEFGSNSWGGGTADHSVWASAMSDGMTLLASAGDDCEQVNYPAAEPDGLGVGGTTITPSGSAFGSETVWSCSGGEGTGGGCDTKDAPPSWQVGMTGFPGSCKSTERGVPDVAMDANPNTGVDIVTKGSVAQYGGTSLASPMWAASLDVIYQASGASGFAAPTIYSLAKSSSYGSLFHDITSGSNGLSATVGWDPDTGVGSPNIGALAAAWTGSTSSPLAATASATPTTGTAPLAVSFTGGASGGTSPYTYSWAFGDGSTSTSQSPSHTYTTAGTYTATLTVTDSPGATAMASVTITVSAATTTLTASASATPTSGTIPLAVAFTGSASGGTSPYTYSWAFGDGSTSTSQSPSHTYTTAGTYTATLTVSDSAGHTATASVAITASPAPTGGCGGITYNINLSQVKDCSLASGAQTVIQFKVSEAQWDDYYYVNVWESDGTVAAGSHFSVGAGLGGTPSLGTAQQTATSPNAKLQISLATEKSGVYGGWGTYWVVVESVGGAGGFCFEAKLTNGALGSGPSCSQPEVTTLAGVAGAPSLGNLAPAHTGSSAPARGGSAASAVLALPPALLVLLLLAGVLATVGALLSRKGDERLGHAPAHPTDASLARAPTTSLAIPVRAESSFARSGAKKQGESEDRDHGGQR